MKTVDSVEIPKSLYDGVIEKFNAIAEQPNSHLILGELYRKVEKSNYIITNTWANAATILYENDLLQADGSIDFTVVKIGERELPLIISKIWCKMLP